MQDITFVKLSEYSNTQNMGERHCQVYKTENSRRLLLWMESVNVEWEKDILKQRTRDQSVKNYFNLISISGSQRAESVRRTIKYMQFSEFVTHIWCTYCIYFRAVFYFGHPIDSSVKLHCTISFRYA